MLNRVTTAMLAVELLVVLVAFRFVTWTPVKAAGGAIVIVAMLLIITARRQLGRAFSVRAKATHLVTTGLYARVRNPIYLAGILLFCGAALLLESWWLLLLLVVLIPLQWARAGREARILHQRFGQQYERYRQQTWF